MKKTPETKLEKLLHERGLTQTQLRDLVLEKTGHAIPLNNLSNMVSKKKEIMAGTAMRLAYSLGVSIEDVLNFTINDLI